MKIIDDNGLTYVIENEEAFVKGTSVDLLINTYKSTLYWYHLNNAMNELVDKKIVTLNKGKEYETSDLKRTLKLLKRELIHRLNVKTFNEIKNDVDLSFLKNKPKNI